MTCFLFGVAAAAPLSPPVFESTPVVFPSVSPDGKRWVRVDEVEGGWGVVVCEADRDCRPVGEPLERTLVQPLWMGNDALVLWSLTPSLETLELLDLESRVRRTLTTGHAIQVLRVTVDTLVVAQRDGSGLDRPITVAELDRAGERVRTWPTPAGFLLWSVGDEIYSATGRSWGFGYPLLTLTGVYRSATPKPVARRIPVFAPPVARADATGLWLVGAGDRGTSLYRIGPRGAQVAAESGGPDIVGLVVSPEGEVLGMATEQERIRWSLQSEQPWAANLVAEVPGDVVHLQIRDGHAVGHVRSPSDRGSLWISDVEGVRLLWRSDAREGYAGTAHAIPTPSGELSVYVTRPDDGAGPWPTVLWLHGGPWFTRDHFAWDAQAQRYADLGYAVVSVDYRGSGGYGWDFMEAAFGRMGSTLEEDLSATTDWAIRQGITDPERIAISGESFGGYAALLASISDERYRCTIATSSPTELVGRAADFLPGERGLAFGSRGARLAASPARQLTRLTRPVLLIHGASDDVVPIDASERLADAAVRDGLPVTFARVQGGHGSTTWPVADRRDAAVLEANFLAGCLGGRAEPWTERSADGTLEVLTGGDFLVTPASPP